MNNGLDKYFKDQLADNELAPSPQVWERIRASGVIGAKKEVAGWRMVRLAAAAAVLLLLGVTAFWSIRRTGAEQAVPAMATNTATDQDKPAAPNVYESPAAAAAHGTEKRTQPVNTEADVAEVAVHQEASATGNPETPKANPGHKPDRKKKIAPVPALPEATGDAAPHTEIAGIDAPRMYLADLATLAPLAPISGIGLPVAVSPESLDETFALEMYLLPIAVHGITPYGEEGFWAAHEEPYEQSVPQKLIKLAGGTITELAEAAGLPVRRWSRITEIEILY